MESVIPNNVVTKLCQDVPLPKMIKVQQKFDESHIPAQSLPGVIQLKMENQQISRAIQPGMKIAITCGSRGVANIALIIKTLVDTVKKMGGKPFVFPAMGSHGGATAKGQRQIIESYGVTEEYVGCPIYSSMETVEIGETEDGMPVFIDKYAQQADGIILCGRIKAHTAFRGAYESGLLKMAVIGMGKQHGAETVHESGFQNMAQVLPKAAKVIFDNTNIIAGVGCIENAFDQTCDVQILTAPEIWEKEPQLLLYAKSRMGRIWFDHLDVLVVDKIGKNISGDGMDPNVTGKFACPGTASGGICVKRVAVLDLTDETQGNANGIGMADITTRRLLNKVNLDETYPNAVTSTVLDVVKMPFVANSDKTAVQLAIRTCNGINRDTVRLVRIPNTTALGEIYISEALLQEALENPNIQVVGQLEEWNFDEHGNLW